MKSYRLTQLLSLAFPAVAVGQATVPDFVTEVKPVLEQHCVRCHQEDKVKGGLRMNNKEDKQ